MITVYQHLIGKCKNYGMTYTKERTPLIETEFRICPLKHLRLIWQVLQFPFWFLLYFPTGISFSYYYYYYYYYYYSLPLFIIQYYFFLFWSWLLKFICNWCFLEVFHQFRLSQRIVLGPKEAECIHHNLADTWLLLWK